jgi:hypothetical protein
VINLDKSFYYAVPWQEVSYLRDTLAALEIPFLIEQDDRLELNPGEVAFVFPNLPIRQFRHVYELFGQAGRLYPQ